MPRTIRVRPEIPSTVLDPIAATSGVWKDLLDCEQFEKEVELLRGSPAFQKFLDERSACSRRIPLEEIEKELERELGTAGLLASSE